MTNLKLNVENIFCKLNFGRIEKENSHLLEQCHLRENTKSFKLFQPTKHLPTGTIVPTFPLIKYTIFFSHHS